MMDDENFLKIAGNSNKLIRFYNKKAFKKKLGNNYNNDLILKKRFLRDFKERYENKIRSNDFITKDDLNDFIRYVHLPKNLNPEHVGHHSAKKEFLLYQNQNENTNVSQNNNNLLKGVKEYVENDEDDIVEIALQIMYGIKTPKDIINERLISFNDILNQLKEFKPPIPTFPHISADTIENSIIQPIIKFTKKDDKEKKNMRTLLHFLSENDLRIILSSIGNED